MLLPVEEIKENDWILVEVRFVTIILKFLLFLKSVVQSIVVSCTYTMLLCFFRKKRLISLKPLQTSYICYQFLWILHSQLARIFTPGKNGISLDCFPLVINPHLCRMIGFSLFESRFVTFLRLLYNKDHCWCLTPLTLC